MAEFATVTIDEVIGRDVNVRGEAKRVFDIKASDGRKYGTFNRKLAEQAGTLKGQVVDIEYSVRVKGDYTNYSLEGLRASESATASTVATNTSSSSEGVSGALTAPQAPSTTVTSKDEQIARAVALKAAVEVVSSGYAEGNIFELAGQYTEWLLTGKIGAQKTEPIRDADPGDETKEDLSTFPF